MSTQFQFWQPYAAAVRARVRVSYCFALVYVLFAPLAVSAADVAKRGGHVVEELIVVGYVEARDAREMGGAVAVFDATDLEARRAAIVADVLRESPGVAVSRTGPTGGLTQLRIRGAESNHTLVLLDGIEVNNPAAGSEFDFSTLLGAGVDRIEILRGAQSALYGSDAIGGVVNVRTRSRGEHGVGGHLDMQGGSFATRQLAARLEGRAGRWHGSASYVDYETDGVSASAIQGERDGYEGTALHLIGGVALSDTVRVEAVWRHQDNDVATDTQDFAFPPTPSQGLVIDANQHTVGEQDYGRIALTVSGLAGRLDHILALDVTQAETANFVAGTFANGNDGERTKYSYTASLDLGSAREHNVAVGVQREELDLENRFVSIPAANYRADDEQTSAIGQYGYRFESGARVDVSARYDRNDRFDDATTIRATASLPVPAISSRVHASVGEGITNPTFFELFGFTPSTFVGNPDLQPERSRGWDVGIETALFEGRAHLDITYFDANLEDEIVTTFDFATFSSTAENQRGESDRKGVEVSLRGSHDAIGYAVSYTYLDAQDPDGRMEVRRAEHTASLQVDYRFAGARGLASMSLLYNGEQEDSEFVFATPSDRVALDDFTLLNAAIRYRLNEHLELFARGENLLDEDYQEVFGYRNQGRAGYLGARVSF